MLLCKARLNDYIATTHNVVCSAADAQATAQQIWDLYLGGSSSNRPFGTAALDGIDLDIEQAYGSQYYADFVDKLQSLWSGASKHYYLTAVPQCELCNTFHLDLHLQGPASRMSM